MTGEELEKVVDKLAEKAGVAVDKMQPIAEEVLRQVEARALVQIICASILVVLIIAASIFFERKADRYDKGMAVFIGMLLAFLGVVFLMSAISAYVAPLAQILGV